MRRRLDDLLRPLQPFILSTSQQRCCSGLLLDPMQYMRKVPSSGEPIDLIDVHFLPQAAAFENVAAQIKTGTVAYSVYALARLFLQKPERYHVRVKTKNASPLFRLGESNAIATNRSGLENSAFRLLRDNFYTTNITLNDP